MNPTHRLRPLRALALFVSLSLGLVSAACDADGGNGEDIAATTATLDMTSGPSDVALTATDASSPTTDADASTVDANTAPDVPSGLDFQVDIVLDSTDGDTGNPTDLADATDAADTTIATDATATDTTDATDVAMDMADLMMAGPFDDLETLDGAALEAALLDRIDEHASLGYDGARSSMYDETTGIDVGPGGVLTCVYTGLTVVTDGSNTPGGTFNTEHSWPQSQGADTEPARSDLHHLFPSNAMANSSRGSYPFGETDCDASAACTWFGGGSELGMSSADNTQVFEVRPVSRGNIARAQFYFAVRYQLDISATTEAFLRSWHAADPPDASERARNEAIFGLQLNRNPFVDRPDFVAKIPDF